MQSMMLLILVLKMIVCMSSPIILSEAVLRSLNLLVDIAQLLCAKSSQSDISLDVGQILEKNTAFISCINQGYCDDKQEKHLYLIIHDFWYGISEPLSGRCACQHEHSDLTIDQELSKRIRIFADRIITALHMRQSQDFVFENHAVPQSFIHWYLLVLQKISTGSCVIEEVIQELKMQWKDFLDQSVRMQVIVFIYYFYLMTREK